MVASPIYLDNQATTRCDPRVVAAMLPYFSEQYGNAGSTGHAFGAEARDAVEQARSTIAAAIGAEPREIVFTSGATESNNLALRGIVDRSRRAEKHLVSVATEHKAILDPLSRLARGGCEVTLLPVTRAGAADAGRLRIDEFAAALRGDTLLASVMLANNEMGVLQPIADLSAICREREVLLHCDATQAVGKIPVDVHSLGVDLMSFSAHKLHGPKGIGALFVRRTGRPVRLQSQIDGGGQEQGLRSGTLNVPAIVGFAKAVELACQELPHEAARVRQLRNRLWEGLRSRLPDLVLNGPELTASDLRLPGNLNVCFGDVQGEALMLATPSVAMSSGSACTSANPEPSHVLRALGRSEDEARASLRFGVGRFNTGEEINQAVDALVHGVEILRRLA